MSIIEALPEEIIEHIALFLDKAGVNCLQITCKKCHECIRPRVLRIDNIKQYETLAKKKLIYLSTLKIDKTFLNDQQVKEITQHCKNLERIEIIVMCTSEADYDLDFDELQLLEIMFLEFYIKDFEGGLTIKGSPALVISKVKILRFDGKIFETNPDKHVKPIILDFRECSNLKSW
jgi:hypothetical protein